MKNEKSFLDKLIDSIFDKTKLLVILTFILGFILRIIAAINLRVAPDNANQSLTPVGIFNSGKLAIWSQSTALWYYIEGVFYKFFGNTTLVSRFTTVLFGSLLIIVMYIFVRKIFKSERVALISSFLVAISPVLIKQTLPEMDVAVAFFLIFSAYFIFRYFETNLTRDLMWSALIMGTGIMIKLYMVMFAASFLVFIIFNDYRKKKIKKETIKKVLIFGLIITALVIPTLAHNYLLYKDKGIMDFIFTNTLGFGKDKSAEYYSWADGWAKEVDYGGFFFGNQIDFKGQPTEHWPGFVVVLYYLLFGDPVIFILGFLGMIILFKKHREYFIFFLIAFLPAFIFLGANIPLEKHFVWVYALLIPAGGYLGSGISKLKFSYIITTMVILISIFNLAYLGLGGSLGGPFYGKSSFGQLVDFKEKEIPETALVIADSRIFRGSIHWAFVGRSYIEASQFAEIAAQLNQQGNLQNIDVYYAECVVDDCNWGTVASQPEFNKSMEEITSFFANVSTFKKDFEAPPLEEYYLPFMNKKETRYRIYKTSLSLNPAILQAVKQTHSRDLLPENYDRSIHPIFDDYEVNGFIDNTISRIAWAIFYFEFFVSFFLLFYAVYLFIGESEKMES